MTVLASSSASSANETALQKEQQLFKELFVRLGNAFLNRIFDLRPERAARRFQYLVILFLFSGFIFSLRVTPLSVWAQYTQNVFSYLFNPLVAANFTDTNPITDFFNLAVRTFSAAEVLQYLPIFLASFFIALQSAAIYLADIFELEDVSVARSFIWEVALSGSDETIRITKGDIADEHRSSSNYLIGGPGKVIVDLDSVALFEKPDGTPHIIGPTGKEKGGKATLEGFERFRQAIDIRDHYVDLRDQDDKSSSVRGRSLDGVPITATDVRLMFSVHRNGKKPETEHPYPFNEKAIERLVYKATSRVTPDLPNPSTFEFSWINNMISLIRSKLGGFMSERNLTVYLASIGQPEYEKAKQREEVLMQQERQLTPPTEDAPKGKEIKPPPEFMPRYKITDLFTQFANEFTNSARDRGVELHWIGVGTWKVPTEIVPETKIVPEKHLEAWKLSQENLKKGSEEAIDKFEKETILLNMATLIQDVPIAAFQKAMGETEHRNAMKSMLLEYRQQLIKAAEFMRANGEAVPPSLSQAIAHIDSVLGYHWAGRT